MKDFPGSYILNVYKNVFTAKENKNKIHSFRRFIKKFIKLLKFIKLKLSIKVV